MSLTQKEASPGEWKKALLPLYIVISALFIVFVIYNYIVGGIYTLWKNTGYQAAIEQLIAQAGAKCEPVAINLWENKIEVVNVACLQQTQTQAQNTQQVQQQIAAPQPAQQNTPEQK